jgi:hypothetical protein
MKDKRTLYLGILVILVVLGIPVVQYHRAGSENTISSNTMISSDTTESTNTTGDSPLFHSRTSQAIGEEQATQTTDYLDQNNTSPHIVPLPLSNTEKNHIENNIMPNSANCWTVYH